MKELTYFTGGQITDKYLIYTIDDYVFFSEHNSNVVRYTKEPVESVLNNNCNKYETFNPNDDISSIEDLLSCSIRFLANNVLHHEVKNDLSEFFDDNDTNTIISRISEDMGFPEMLILLHYVEMVYEGNIINVLAEGKYNFNIDCRKERLGAIC